MMPMPCWNAPLLARWLLAGWAAALASCQNASTGASSGVPRVDLTSKNWFPPVVRQQGNSCAQQAGLYYLLNAERNRERGLSSWQTAHRLSPYQTYAILADSPTSGTYVTDGWNLARETGVPWESDFPRSSCGLMHGFEKYVRAARQRPASWKLLPFRTTAGLRAAKDLLAAGHPLACDFQIRGSQLQKRPDGSTLITAWGRTGPGHNMVYAGYDDTIGFDFNHDGRITNDLDITGDGQVTLADHELGAFLVINPWGPGWGTRGKAWAFPREHALSTWPRAGEIATVLPAPDHPPRLMLRISLALQERSSLMISVSDGAHSDRPLPFRRSPAALPSGSAWDLFSKLHRPGPSISPGPLANPAGGPLEMGLELPSLTPGKLPATLTLSSSGPPLRGTLCQAALVELSGTGQILRETAFPGLPAVLPAGGGSWTTP